MQGRSKVPAADQTLRILRLLARQRGPILAKTISTQLELPKSTVYQLLEVLIDHGFVVHLADSHRYGLSISAFDIGSSYLRQEPLTLLGRVLLAELVDAVGESAHLAVMHGRDVLYIAEERAPGRPHLITGVGVRLPAHLTASGLAMLASMPREQIWALYPSGSEFVDRTGLGPSTNRELRAELAVARARGYAQENGSVELGLRSVGVEVLDHQGWPAAAIALTFSIDSNLEPVDVAAKIAPFAKKLSRRIRAGAS